MNQHEGMNSAVSQEERVFSMVTELLKSVQFTHTRAAEIARLLRVKPPRRVRRFCRNMHEITAATVAADGSCLACKRIRARVGSPLAQGKCACGHSKKAHDGECYHRDSVGEFDCHCQRFRKGAE